MESIAFLSSPDDDITEGCTHTLIENNFSIITSKSYINFMGEQSSITNPTPPGVCNETY